MRLFFFFFFPSRMEHIIIKVMAKCTVSSYCFSKATWPDAMCTSVLLYIVIREKYILLFPRRLPRTLSPCEKAPWGCLGQFSFNKIFFFFFFFAYCNHSALLLHRFPSCSASAVSLVKSRKSVAEQLRNKQQIMASKRKSREHLCF